MKTPVKDRRQYERFKARHHFTAKHFNGDGLMQVILKDISKSGLRLRAKKCMLSDDNISLVFENANGEPNIVIDGKIVWTKSAIPNLWDVGIEFKGVSFARMNELFKLLF